MSRRARIGTAALLAGLTLISFGGAGRAAFGQGMEPATPPARPTHYDPDPITCQPDVIRSGFERQLQPFADQSPAVLQRLRQVQVELTAASLRRCVERGLLSREQASALAAELLSTSPPEAQPRPSTRP